MARCVVIWSWCSPPRAGASTSIASDGGGQYGIAVHPSGTIAYTTSFLSPAQLCTHPVNADGTLGVMLCATTTCTQPLELYAATDRIVVVCRSGDVDAHPLDTQLQPMAPTTFSEPSGIRGAALAPSGKLYLASGGDELIRVDAASLAEIDRHPLRAGTTGIAIAPDERHVFGGDPAGVAAYDASAAFAVVASADIGGTAISVIAR